MNKNFNSTKRNCPVCDSSNINAKIFLEENYVPEKINKYTYASRKNPEFMCYELVECNVCDLVYANSPPSVEELSSLYHEAEFDSNDEANEAAKSYIISLDEILNEINKKNTAIDIGTGTGILLDKLKERGFKKVIGVEPSKPPINHAPEYRKKWIIHDIFKKSYFKENSIDLIFCAMTMEHVRDPKDITLDAYDLLSNGGAVAFVVHDRRSLVNRILGKKSPIIDLEHLQIFSKKSMFELLDRCGFDNIKIKSFKNTYPLKYWVRLTPLPNFLKNIIIRVLQLLLIDKIKISINVGNMLACGFKVSKKNK